MPYEGGSNRAWLLASLGQRIRPEWNADQRQWEIARPHLQTLLEAMVGRFDVVNVYLVFSSTERCDVRCREATGDDCECSCRGEHHGGGTAIRPWRLVGEYTLINPAHVERHFQVDRACLLTD